MAYDFKKGGEIMHRLVMEDKTKQEQEEKEIVKRPSATAGMNGEHIDKCDIPGAMDDGVALLLYIIVMVAGVIFNARWLIWIGATIAYLCHVFRRQIHKAKWEREHKDQ